MNIIFTIIVIFSCIILIFLSPDSFLSAMISGGEKALSLTLKLVVIYAIWLGIFEVVEKTGLADKFAKLLKPLNKFLYGKIPDSANNFISLNMSANMLGMSGATTPMGIKAINELEKYKGTYYAIAMFFVINATSIQIIPSSVMALRSSMGAISPGDIILPTILSTLISTITGVILVKIFIRKSY